MRTTITINIDTNNMTKLYNTDDSSQFTPENEITEAMEEQIHQAIIQIIKSNLTEELLDEALINNCIPDFEFMGIDDWVTLSEYGSIRVTYENEGTQEREILADFVGEKIEEPDTVSDKIKKQIQKAVGKEENIDIEEEEIDNEDDEVS